MKNNILILSIVILFSSCKQKDSVIISNTEDKTEVKTLNYPDDISKILESHGGLKLWNTMQTLAFTMEKPEGNEVTLTALKTRKSLITMPKHSIGFDGEKVWLQKKDTTSYKGNPKFYYNLMFYFYAMPFVLADDGIVYEDVLPLHFENVDYPGIKISYNVGVGESPEDEYILYYNPKTYKMEWLGYTVTYFSKEKSKEFHFIRYTDWQTIEELSLPKTLTWYNSEANIPTSDRNALDFINIELSKIKTEDALFIKPDNAEFFD